MNVTSSTRQIDIRRKVITSYKETTSPDKVETVQQEHIQILQKELPKIEKDADNDIVPFIITQAGGGALGTATYQVINIPRNITQVELASSLEALGAESGEALIFSKHVIEKISDPTVRNVVISVGTGLAFFTFIFKSNLPLWLKIGLSLAVVGVGLYLTFKYLPNPTEPKTDDPPQQETVIENESN